MSLPRGFVPIKEARDAGPSANFIGVLTHCKGSYKTKGADWALEFTIQDEFHADISMDRSSIPCRIFRKSKDLLPEIGTVGDLVLLRNIQIKQWNTKCHLVSSARLNTAILFFQSKKVPVPALSTPYAEGGLAKLPFSGPFAVDGPSPSEQMAIIQLKATATPFLPKVRQQLAERALEPLPKKPNDKRALIKDIVLYKYYDIVGEVVKKFSPNPSTMDLYVTDYTTNTELFLYEDPDEVDPDDFTYENTKATKWPGPFGQMTMAIRLWEPHASYAYDKIHEGDVVILKDVHAKLSQANKLEGALHQDQMYSEKVKIRKVEYAYQTDDLKARKAAYQKAYEERSVNRDNPHAGPKKPSAKASAKKKETKKQMRQLQKELEQKELADKAEEDTISRLGINKYVRAPFPEIRPSTVEDIIHNPSLKTTTSKGVKIVLPFVNAKYRTRVRVVDFAPKDLEDFARSMIDLDWNPSLSDLTLDEKRYNNKWAWGFVLLVEDANVPAGATPERLPLFVNNEAGQALLKMDATDLRRNHPQRRALKQLEEKLFILWGNLFELKKELSPKDIKFPLSSHDQRLQNMPFECCIEEYGSEVPVSVQWPQGWQRMHSPMQTTIVD